MYSTILGRNGLSGISFCVKLTHSPGCQYANENEPHHEKISCLHVYAKTKTQISCALTAFGFASRMVQSLFLPYSKVIIIKILVFCDCTGRFVSGSGRITQTTCFVVTRLRWPGQTLIPVTRFSLVNSSSVFNDGQYKPRHKNVALRKSPRQTACFEILGKFNAEYFTRSRTDYGLRKLR